MRPDLDLAFCLEDGEGKPLAPSLQPLRAAAGAWADEGAEPRWHALLSSWLRTLQPLLPAHLVSTAYSLGLQLTDDATITTLNGQWRQLWQPTDVLSFAAQESGDDALPPMPRPAPALLPRSDPEPHRSAAEAVVAGEFDAEIDEEIDEAFEGDFDGEFEGEIDPGLELGDIVISLETAARQAGEGPGALEHELLFLASHGLLHLLGWDHPDEASLTAMLTLQQDLLNSVLDPTDGGIPG